MSDIKRRKLTQMTTMMDLSSDLLEEILLRAPAKSLAVMKLTCKQCKALIEDPNFVEKHFSRFCCREQQFTIITDVSAASNPSSSSSASLRVSCIGLNFNCLKKPSLDIEVFVPGSIVEAVYECDGLLLLVMKPYLAILNPSLQRGKVISVPSRYGYSYCDYVYGLGYVRNPSRTTNSKDYKIVKFSCDRNLELDLWVYDFKSKSWNEVFVEGFDGFFSPPFSSVCVRGAPYWLGISKGGTTIYLIQSFDFERGCFEPLSLPPTTFGWGGSPSLGVFKGDYISLLHRSTLAGKLDLWVKKQQQWNRMFTVVIPELAMFHIRSSYMIENNSKLVVAGSHYETTSVTIYVVGESEELQKVEYRCETNDILDICYYVPSLVNVPGFSR